MSGILSDLDMNEPQRRRPVWPNVEAKKGLTVRHRSSGYVGKVRRFTATWIMIVDLDGREQTLRNERGAFSVEGKTVNLVAPKVEPDPTRATTASGSIAQPNEKARVARASRILVEGLHDAELVEKVWGDDLRIEGVVVEPLHGADDLAAVVRQFGPRSGRRLGILLDHLVDHTKESRIAATIDHPDVLITGHPYVDIWQAIRPAALGIDEWPTIPKGTDWKTGICAEFGFHGPPGEFWKHLLGRVNSYANLEPGLVGAVEQLIDFVTAPSRV